MLSISYVAKIIEAFIVPSRCLDDLRNAVTDYF